MQEINEQFLELNSKTGKMIAALQNGISWINTHGDKASRDTKSRLLNKDKRTLNRVLQASEKRSSIAVFGQSQVGKSFLVRSLAKSPRTSKLEILNSSNGERIDFLQKINPPGGRESTGIITRFSTSSPKNISNDFPYQVELLTQMDVAAIIVNGYLEDIQEYIQDLDKEEILSSVATYKENLNSNIQTDLCSDEVYDFIEYLATNYKDDYRIKYCQEIDFFNDLVTILPKIEYNQRWELLQFLWGKNEFLTNVFNKLSDTLSEIEFSKIAFVNDDAIINSDKDPRFSNTTNILDVERVKEMFYSPTLEPIEVSFTNAKIKKIAISEFTALIKELHFEIPNDFAGTNEREFLEYTDILDFPGSKSRDKIPESVFNSNGEDAKLSLLVRGKVSYLFYLYNRDIGISTLLYCMDNEPPLVSDSPGLLEKWIRRYIGSGPEARQKHESTVLDLLRQKGIDVNVNHVSPLLVAMTKFNVELSGKGAADVVNDPDSHNSKWHARFKENFSNYMSKPVEDKWTENWTAKGEAFKFIFPIRDPGFSGTFFEGYEPINQLETKIRPEKEAILEDMKTSFLKSEVVDKFIYDKEELWNELLSPNKTGIDYLCKYLEASSHPINMLTQLNSIIEETISHSLKILGSEYSSGNMEEDLKEARIKGAKAFASILNLGNNNDSSLSNYLKQLVTTENEIWKLLYEFRFTADEEQDEEALDYTHIKDFLSNLGIEMNAATSKDLVKQQLIDFFGVPEDQLNEILKDQIGVDIENLFRDDLRTKNSSELFAEKVLSHWADKLMSISFKNSTDNIEGNHQVFNTIISEILKSNVKYKLQNQIIGIIDSELNDGINKEKFNLISSSVTSLLNRYVFSLTWLYQDEEKKPVKMKNNQAVFSNHSVLKGRDSINSAVLENSTNNYIQDFSFGAKELFVANVTAKYGLDNNFNTEVNAQVGRIIEDINTLAN